MAIMNKNREIVKPTVEEIVLEVMRYFGYRHNYQVAKFFNVTPQTLSGWIKSGEIPPKHLIKYNSLVMNDESYKENKISKEKTIYSSDLIQMKYYKDDLSINRIKKIIYNNFKVIFFVPLISVTLMSLYVFFVADPVFTSKSKVLPISDDNSASSSFSGFASQLGINIPLNIGGKVPWDEIYPEILKSGDLLESMLNKKYNTKKYGLNTLKNILISENSLEKFSQQDQKNRVLGKLREMIKISKNRNSPIVNIDVLAFEPIFASELSTDLILKSSLVQRELKTKRIKQKRLFIEERLMQVSKEMKLMERELRQFRENNRNLSSSPSLQMMVQEMGREVDLQNSLYVTLKTQYEKAKIDEVGRDDMVQQIDGPSIPTKLTKPQRLLSISLSLFFGLFAMVFIIYLKENFIIKQNHS